MWIACSSAARFDHAGRFRFGRAQDWRSPHGAAGADQRQQRAARSGLDTVPRRSGGLVAGIGLPARRFERVS